MTAKTRKKSLNLETARKPAESKEVEVETKSNKAIINKLVADLNKKFGENAVTLGFPKNENGEELGVIKRLPTGSFSLDIALGGGLPLGRYIEISGGYSSTKTTQCMHIIREAQKAGYVCALIDVEGTTDEKYARAIGVDFENLIYCRPDSMEEATQAILDLQKSGEVQIAVLDSIAAMIPNKERESDMDETVRMGLPQSLLGEFFRKYQANNNRLSREGKMSFTVIGVNQLREKIGAYGDPEYAPGGRAKGFTASVDIRLRRGDWISEGTGNDKEIVGQVVKFKIEKNKTYKRMQTGEFDFYFSPNNNAGIRCFYNDTYKEVIMCAVEYGVIKRAGAWFVIDDEHRYQGLEKLINALKEDTALIEDLKRRVLEEVSRL